MGLSELVEIVVGLGEDEGRGGEGLIETAQSVSQSNSAFYQGNHFFQPISLNKVGEYSVWVDRSFVF